MNKQKVLHVGAVQMNPLLGNVASNIMHHQEWIEQAQAEGLELLVFPELSLTGYGLKTAVPQVAMEADDERLHALAAAAGDMQVIIGFVEEASPGEYCNAMAMLQHGEVVSVYRKMILPTYGGLEEGKWFSPGRRLVCSEVQPGWRSSSLICEDLWNAGVVHCAMMQRPEVLCASVNSASGIVSTEFSNEDGWPLNLKFYAHLYGTPVIMANRYGPEGESLFWGGTSIYGPRGELLALAEPGEQLIRAELCRDAIAAARFDHPTHRDANTPLIIELLRQQQGIS
ncbi:NAD+ synthetase [Billgrantia diversa]|uniref:nitrilase-related carbon-nitrogen hydrolase n=1 Tax=Halomonas sp. MCCC 1A13316 TaxID=2733487 RepID=UPI0018A5DE7A|nr:nitrilase-related carbon-nitrogen hydrolase [Halomonas sp. MCCC 1A13316]QOR37744.1 NAD+ synthetase [Halomonas sp. MCCC 1A13316]